MTSENGDYVTTYKHAAIYRIAGISLGNGEAVQHLYSCSERGVRVDIRSSPEFPSADFDARTPIAGLVFRGLLSPEMPAEKIHKLVADEVQDAQTERQKNFPDGPFLVVTIQGETPALSHDVERDYGSFIVGMSDEPSSSSEARCAVLVRTILNSLALTVPGFVGRKKVAGATLYFRENSKPIYSFVLVGGRASMYVSSPLSQAEISSFGELFEDLIGDSKLERVQRLLSDSYDADRDSLRSFLHAWTAFEVLVNSAFKSTYEDGFLTHLAKEAPKLRPALEQLRESGPVRYPLLVKFASIGCLLDPKAVCHDMTAVRAVKKTRDDFAHGEAVDTDNLPVGLIRDITRRYLRLHFNRLRRLPQDPHHT